MKVVTFFFILAIQIQVFFANNFTLSSVNVSEQDYENNLGELQNLTEYFGNIIFGTIPALNLTISEEITSKCRQQSATYLRQLNNFEIWALQMYDSSAKIPSGILNGNLNQLGDFDECINVHSEPYDISGQYCLANFQIAPPKSKHLHDLHTLLNSNFLFNNTLEDPGHLAPRYSSIHWALCVPSTCTHTDVEIALKHALRGFNEKSGLSIGVKVHEELCQTGQRSIPASTIIGGLLYAGVIGFTLVVSAMDIWFQYPLDETGIPGILLAFSLRRTVRALLSMKRAEDDIASVHGLRFLNMFMLFAAHKSINVLFLPYVNRTPMSEIFGQSWTVLGRTASLYTDTFLMFSGMLTIYSYFGQTNRGKRINFFDEYISRLMRIVPPLAAVILFTAVIQPWLGSGPFWNLVVTKNAEICKNYGWRNLLSIQNYFGFENMCAANTHHVGTDTQLFFVSPLFFWILWKWQKRGVFLLIVLAALSTALRFYVTFVRSLSNYIYFGISLKSMYDTADYMYTWPVHRATVYIFGVLLGYFLRNAKNVHLKPQYLRAANVTALLLFCLAFFGPAFMSNKGYKFEPIHGAWYAGLAPVPWCLAVAWVVFTKHFRYSNRLNRFLSWRGFLVTTRLSYAVYLIQFPIFFHTVGITRNSDYFHIFKILPTVQEFLAVISFAIILTVLFDLPFQQIRRILFKRNQAESRVEDTRIKDIKKTD